MTRHDSERTRATAQPWLDEYPRLKDFVELHWWWAIPAGVFVGIVVLSTAFFGLGELLTLWGWRA